MQTKTNNILLISEDKKYQKLIRKLLAEIETSCFSMNMDRFKLHYSERISTGINYLKRGKIDLVVLDVPLPGHPRLEALSKIYAKAKSIPIIVLLERENAKMAMQVLYGGAMDCLIKEDIDSKLLIHSIHFAFKQNNLLVKLMQSRDEVAKLNEEQKGLLDNLKRAFEGVIFTISKIIEKRDPYTAGHQERVARLAKTIALEMDLPGDKCEGIYWAGIIHDIGKIHVPIEILTYPGKLNEDEFNLVKAHSVVGYNILKDIDLPWPIAKIVLEHHERINGSGYPNGLKGKEIMLEARIMGVADVVEAMCAHRPYRPAPGKEKAIKEIIKNRKTLYDSNVVDACLKLIKEKGFRF